MGSDDVVLAFLEENQASDEVIEAHKASPLRKQIGELSKWKSEVGEPAVTELSSLRKAPVRDKAFEEHANVDTSKLTESQKFALSTFDWEGDAPTPEEVTAFAAKFSDLPTKASQTPEGTQSGAAAIVGQAQSAQGNLPPAESLDDQVREAEAKGDYATAMRLKTAAQLETAMGKPA